ncbi:lymphocyte antigen 6C2-like [Carassius gibelio]|uniref:lymphocyte antigen 6C2-like n=1 Tax=Carassius gibelio TaxID=101364 RepID=UPI0022784D79|nr:lymphocyte antigen 6C2-like [Carassius gibelio]
MDLQISVFLLSVLFTAGQSLSCYKCVDPIVSCADPKVETCPSGFKCMTGTPELGFGSMKVTTKVKGCLPEAECKHGTIQTEDGITGTLQCCNTDLCNAADGVYKRSFLLLWSLLFFYILFQ